MTEQAETTESTLITSDFQVRSQSLYMVIDLIKSERLHPADMFDKASEIERFLRGERGPASVISA